MGSIFFSKQQIEFFVQKIGQPKASILLQKIFNSYRNYLDSNDVQELYDEDYLEGIRSTPIYQLVDNRYKIHIYNKYSYEYLLTKEGRGSVLDIGCGDGHFLLALSFHGFKCMGIDLSRTLIKEAQLNAAQNNLGVEFLCEDSCNLSLNSCFDFIVLNDITEHLSDRELQNLFGKIIKLLNPNGEIIIHTPNGLALCNETDRSFLQRIYKKYLTVSNHIDGYERTIRQIFYDQVHINIKSYQQIRKLLSQIGLESKVIYDNYNRSILRSVLSTNMLIIAWVK
jgi:2-polyprenyl-3-methyl-5-hydroxy-6-metoxy-1,4-benzoquinol methylase